MYNYLNFYMQTYDINQPKLAEAYIPFQKYVSAYPPEEGLKKGTIFPELDKPYLGEKMRWY